VIKIGAVVWLSDRIQKIFPQYLSIADVMRAADGSHNTFRCFSVRCAVGNSGRNVRSYKISCRPVKTKHKLFAITLLTACVFVPSVQSAVAKNAGKRLSASKCLSVCPPARIEQLGFHTGEIFMKKVNVYLPSLMMKVPDHLYVLGDTYTCHT
jgi:hypothetical protein